MSAEDNITFRHAIVPISEERIIDRSGPAYYFLWMHKRRLGPLANLPFNRDCAHLIAKHILAVQPRISVVFRDIATLVPLAEARKNAAKSIKEREKRQRVKRDRQAAKDAENAKKLRPSKDDDDEQPIA